MLYPDSVSTTALPEFYESLTETVSFDYRNIFKEIEAIFCQPI
jgi:hypothetical protein